MIKKLIIGVLGVYKKYISCGSHCRFVPSCSEYARQAVEKYGVVKGLWMGWGRVLRCNRWSEGGVDKV